MATLSTCWRLMRPLNESPSEKEGKSDHETLNRGLYWPSMKVPPKRKGNESTLETSHLPSRSLNESPSEKEGKYLVPLLWCHSD